MTTRRKAKHPAPLTREDWKAIQTAVSMIDADIWDRASYGARPDFASVLRKVADRLAFRGVSVDLTRKELEMLNHGLGNGIADDAIGSIGLNKREQLQLGGVANHLLDLAASGAPRYYDERDDR